MPTMMFISSPVSVFMIFSAIQPAMAPRMIDRIQPKPSMHFPFLQTTPLKPGWRGLRMSMHYARLAFPQAPEIVAICQIDRQMYFISR